MRKLIAALLILLGIAFMLLSFAAAAVDLFGPFPSAYSKSMAQGGLTIARLIQLFNALRELIQAVISMPQWLLFAITGLILIFSGMRFWDKKPDRRRA